MAAIEQGNSIVVFPEDSTNGYLAELEGFFAGFTVLAETALKRGKDLPIVVTYYKKDELIYVIDKPVMYSELLKECGSKEKIAEKLVKRCNELGKMSFTQSEEERKAA